MIYTVNSTNNIMKNQFQWNDTNATSQLQINKKHPSTRHEWFFHGRIYMAFSFFLFCPQCYHYVTEGINCLTQTRCLCLCICMHAYSCMHMHMHAYDRMHMHICKCISIHAYAYLHMHTCICIHAYASWICMHYINIWIYESGDLHSSPC